MDADGGGACYQTERHATADAMTGGDELRARRLVDHARAEVAKVIDRHWTAIETLAGAARRSIRNA